MDNKQSYERLKTALLTDKTINKSNRELWARFFELEEKKLKRMNGLAKNDEKNYKTLCGYPNKLRNVNSWLKNKPWSIQEEGHFTKEDFEKVYEALEDGELKTVKGKIVLDKTSYYHKIFKSKPFELAGQKPMVLEVIQFSTTNKKEEVKFFTEEDFRKTVVHVPQPKHKLILWLGFDIGENITSLLQLKKKDCRKEFDKETNSFEYKINLRKETLKRSRTPRSEPTLYRETVELLDLVLQEKEDDDFIFDFGQKMTEKSWRRAIKISGVKCQPAGEVPTLKDLRSSMACNLLKKEWSNGEVNARLGHTPNSSALNRYITFLALDKKKPKVKMQQSKIGELERTIEEMKEKEKLNSLRLENMKQDSQRQDQEMTELKGSINQLIARTNAGLVNIEKNISYELAVALSKIKTINELNKLEIKDD